jgi:serine phosphatase RsbU (regulator of sigma subunit)
MQVLLVEDVRADRMLLQAFLEQHGHRVRAAETADAALAGFDPYNTDLVLMGGLMPGMYGIEAMRRLKAQASDHWIPVILISDPAQDSEVVRGLRAGADDYLVKPVNLVALEAKLRIFQRIAQIQRQSRAHARMLATYREQAEAELEIATSLIGGVTQQGSLQDEQLSWAVLPSARFSGDTVAALRTDSGRLLAMLADATGHGLPAAISLLPALQVFYGMARKDLDVPSIAREMNRRIREQMPTGLYLAAVLLGVDLVGGQAQVWNGGMPPGIWVRGGTTPSSAALSSSHLPLGVLDDAGFDATPGIVDSAMGGYLVFYSDGLVEARNAAGEPFGVRRLHDQLVGRTRIAGLHATLDSLAAHLHGRGAHDDVSLLMVSLD